MFYIWHTLLIIAFLIMAFFMGIILGRRNKLKNTKFKSIE
jgi:hypothetical protein